MPRRVYVRTLALVATIVIAAFLCSEQMAGGSPPLNGELVVAPPPLEGCLKCHDQIEPMHKFGPTVTLEKLNNGRDAMGLKCTECHGGNPVAITKDEAHVRPRFPREWIRDGKFRIPERSGPLLARESLEFVRFINPGDLRVAGTTCGSADCHSVQTNSVRQSMMTHGAMLWGAALYNN